MAARYAFAFVAALSACATPQGPAVIEVPVEVRPEPPAELLAHLSVEPLPVFVSPADPAASSAVTPEGERRLQALLGELLARVRAWEAWAEN